MPTFFFLNTPGCFGLLLSINFKITLTFFIGSGTLDGIQCLLYKWTMSIDFCLFLPYTPWLRFSQLCLVSQSCLMLCDPMDCSPSGSSVHRDSSGKNTAVGCHALLQRIFPTQGSNPGLPHCKWILYHLSHQGSPWILEWVAYPFCRGSSWPRNWTGVSCIAGRFFTSRALREAPYFPIVFTCILIIPFCLSELPSGIILPSLKVHP